MKRPWQDDAQLRMSPNLPQFGRTRGLCSCDLDSGLLIRTKWNGGCSDTPLWAFDRGIYFVEEVKYTGHKPYLEFHSAPR